MKVVLYVVIGFIAMTAAALLITHGEAPANNSFALIGFVLLFVIPPVGAFWMMYEAIRNETKPFSMIVLAFVPFTFLWYYFERFRPTRNRKRH